jgi:hypothetical protein
MQKVVSVSTAALLMLAVLSGCTPAKTVEPTTTPSPTTPTETASPTTPSETFTMPSDCTTILPESRIASFSAENIILLAGPGGKYGDELITQSTPEMDAGGISCYFGVDSDDPSLLSISVLLSVVPLNSTNSSGVISTLEGQGLLKGTDTAGHLTYGIAGNSSSQTTAAYSVVTTDSWISGVSGTGGEDSLTQLMQLTSEMHDVLYN